MIDNPLAGGVHKGENGVHGHHADIGALVLGDERPVEDDGITRRVERTGGRLNRETNLDFFHESLPFGKRVRTSRQPPAASYGGAGAYRRDSRPVGVRRQMPPSASIWSGASCSGAKMIRTAKPCGDPLRAVASGSGPKCSEKPCFP